MADRLALARAAREQHELTGTVDPVAADDPGRAGAAMFFKDRV